MSASADDTARQRHEALFEARLAELGIELNEHDRQRLWASYLKQIELAAAWTRRLDPAAEPALEFRPAEETR